MAVRLKKEIAKMDYVPLIMWLGVYGGGLGLAPLVAKLIR